MNQTTVIYECGLCHEKLETITTDSEIIKDEVFGHRHLGYGGNNPSIPLRLIQ